MSCEAGTTLYPLSLANLLLTIVAAVSGTIAAWFAWRQHKDGDRARMAEIVEIVAEIDQCTRFGWPTAFQARQAQQRLRARLVGLDVDLPEVDRLAGAQLENDQATADISGAALEEARGALAKHD